MDYVFQMNIEFTSSDEFSGNIILLKELKVGLQKICDIKSLELIKTKELVSISSNDDYIKFEQYLSI